MATGIPIALALNKAKGRYRMRQGGPEHHTGGPESGYEKEGL